eukprot:TRINITY_DN18210_c0_g1_i1.p1 TRINITY_DN18210_c0_g1~~TRINITY_DN18210_c0_g1_i1.p1  ORF type:complete len:396 (-),score=66.04 TRINITY_DN18210_c0_g1_i1:164-1351(-)
MSSYAHGYGAISGGVGGGLGGGSGGAGDDYRGIYFHEMGHAFGLGHANDEFNDLHYPYPGRNGNSGGGVGATWGYEQDTGNFVSPYIVGEGTPKQDPMQGGSGDQLSPRLFTMFSDYNAKRIYDNVAGSFYPSVTKSQILKTPQTMAPFNDLHYQLFNSSGRTILTSSGLFEQWNGTNYVPTTSYTDYPIQMNVPVYTVFGSFSFITPEVRLFHDILHYKGNYKLLIDPNNEEHWNYVKSSSFCYWGCDFLLCASYKDGKTSCTLIQNDNSRKSGFTDPKNSLSFLYFGANFLDLGSPLIQAELFYRPLSKLTTDSYYPNHTFISSQTYFRDVNLVMKASFNTEGGNATNVPVRWSINGDYYGDGERKSGVIIRLVSEGVWGVMVLLMLMFCIYL